MKTHRIVGIAALVVWIHLGTSIYPLPSQRVAGIASLARDAVSSQEYLRSRGINLPQATEQDVISELTSESWTQWAQSLVLLVLGVGASLWAIAGRRGWEIPIIALSTLVLIVTTGPVIADVVRASSLNRWFETWQTVTRVRIESGEKVGEYFALLYKMFVWPIYHLGLIVAAVATKVFRRVAA